MAGDTVQQIKDKLTIQDVVAPYVKLSRAGRSLKGLCPFHKEKTPSFTVNEDKGGAPSIASAAGKGAICSLSSRRSREWISRVP